MPLRTTCLGAFPKPGYVPIKDWFQVDLGAESYAQAVVAGWTDLPEHDVARRENYVHYQCRHFTGFDFETLERRVLRNGAYDCHLPAIRDRVTARKNVLVRDYVTAQAASPVPVKITLPGPMTIIDSTADCHYKNDQRLAFDLAAALNTEIRALAEAGCQHIQVDEPVFARKPTDALAYGVEALERSFHGVQGVVRTMHMCCGYPDRLDNLDYPKADHRVYHPLVEALDGRVDAISIEDCHRNNDLALFEKFQASIAIVGFVDVAVSQVETVDEIQGRMRDVLSVIPAERVIAAPDCGLGFLGADLAKQKLRNLSIAAGLV